LFGSQAHIADIRSIASGLAEGIKTERWVGGNCKQNTIETQSNYGSKNLSCQI
jgi:hypothetical protein